MKNPLTPIFSMVIQGRVTLPANNGFRRYHGIAIRYYVSCACDAVQQIDTKTLLSDKPFLYLETKRFLVNEIQPLPLPNCTAPRCRCCYMHYKDRREVDRRTSLSNFLCSSFFVGLECRLGKDRRNSYSAADQ